MRFFAANLDGELYDLGDNKDADTARGVARDMGVDPIWLVRGPDALLWASTITAGMFDQVTGDYPNEETE